MKNFFEETAIKDVNLKGKFGAAFGSYGWSGEAPRMVIEIMKNKFEMNVPDPPLLIKHTLDHADLDKVSKSRKEYCRKAYSQSLTV